MQAFKTLLIFRGRQKNRIQAAQTNPDSKQASLAGLFAHRKRTARFHAFLVLTFVLCAFPAHATNFRTYGFGARAIAMGGAMAGHVDDFTATYYNPAGLAASRISDFSIGVQYVDIDVSASNPSPIPDGHVRFSDAFPIDDAVGMYGGMRFMIPFADALENRIGFGLSFFQGLPNALDVEVPFGFTPQYALLNGQTNLMIIEPGLGVRLFDGFHIGVSADIFSDVGGNLEVPTGFRGSDGVNDALTLIDQEVQPVIRASAGFLMHGSFLSKALKNWSMGVAWRDSFGIPLQIPVIVTLGPIPLNIGLKSELLWTPMQTVLGLAYRTEDLTLAFDLSWNRWSQYKPPTLELELDIVIPVVPIDLKNATNPDPGTRDTWSPRVGAEWQFVKGEKLGLCLRGGYAYEPSPFPEQTGRTNYLDDNRHLFSAGLGLSLEGLPGLREKGGVAHVDLGFQYNLIESRRHHKEALNPLFASDSNPLGFPPIQDDAGNPIADPGYPSIEGDADVFLILLTLRTTFGGTGR